MSSTPSTAFWFYQSPQGNQGPYSIEQLRWLASQGRLSPQTLVWRDGLPNWVPLGSVLQTEGQPRGAASAQQPSAAQQGQAQSEAARKRDDYLDGVFSSLVTQSWKRFQKKQLAKQIDEVLVGAVITATLDNGFELIDLESDGQEHYLRFEQLQSGARVIFAVHHHAESLVTARVLGHEATVTIGYGERIRDFSRVWTAVKQEFKGSFVREAEPGIVRVDGDISSQYIYVEVGLLWDLNDYLSPDDPYRVNYARLTEHIGATVHALRKYLYGRFRS